MCIIKRLNFCIVVCFMYLYLFVIIAHTLTTIYKYFYMFIYINPLSHSNYVSRYKNIMNCILQNDCSLHNIIDLLRRGINRSKNANIIQLTNVIMCYCHHDGVLYLDTHQHSVYIRQILDSYKIIYFFIITYRYLEIRPYSNHRYHVILIYIELALLFVFVP